MDDPWGKTPTGAEIIADMMAAADRIMNDPVPSPCGAKENPHIVHPYVAAGKRAGHCGNCGTFLVPTAAGLAVRG
jgi:hypothetical protein